LESLPINISIKLRPLQGLEMFAHQYFYQITPPSGLGEFAHQYFYQITPPSGLEEIANQLSNYTAP
jgi:hypothetical protein